jgi:PE-PPE domain/PE family
MTYVITEPRLMATVAADVDGIGSAISTANAAAASPISGVAAAAGDEVSELIANLFGAYGQEYQAVSAQAAAFHNQFSGSLAAAGSAYAAAEAANATAVSGALNAFTAPIRSMLGGSGTTGVVTAPTADPHFDVAIVMGGTGNPLPNMTFSDGVLKWATTGNFSWTTAQSIFTPEQLYPLTGVRSLPLDISVSQGVASLDAAIKQQIGVGNTVLVQGYSQSSIIASLEMQNLLNPALNPTPPTGAQLGFNLLADPMNPNGGLLARFAGLTLPSIGLDFYGATPSNTPWTTTVFSLEYDGFADFPRYPIDFLSDLNAVAGIALVHPLYPHLDPSTVTLVKLPVESTYTGPLANTTYYMGLTPNLPLLAPLRVIPVVGNPLADLLQPDLKYLVNWGYGDPQFGYSTAPANVPTPFGLFPPLSATTALPGDLLIGAQQGIHAFNADMGTMSTQAMSTHFALPPAPQLAAAPASFPSPVKIVNTLTSIVSTDYAVLLPTADIGLAFVTSFPLYDAQLFVNQLAQGNLLNAIGYPIAADVGLATVAGGVGALTVLEAAISNIRDIQSLIS